jgi:hypothetical protein
MSSSSSRTTSAIADEPCAACGHCEVLHGSWYAPRWCIAFDGQFCGCTVDAMGTRGAYAGDMSDKQEPPDAPDAPEAPAAPTPPDSATAQPIASRTTTSSREVHQVEEAATVGKDPNAADVTVSKTQPAERTTTTTETTERR